MRDFLIEFLKAYPSIPSHALWRAIEAKLLFNEHFEYPLLDLACGDGLSGRTIFADKEGKIIFGCDISNECVAKAKLYTDIYKSVEVADGRCLPYKDNQFATVLSNCVLEHIPEDYKVLREVSRVLRENGRFIFTVPSENFVNNLRTQDKNFVENLNKRLEHFHYRSPQEWERLLEECGLTLEKFRYYLPPVVQKVWEELLGFETKKLMGRELGAILGSKKIGMWYITRLLYPIIFNRALRRQYLMGTSDNRKGGALLIIARKVRCDL